MTSTEGHEPNRPTAMRTHLCGVLRTADVGSTVRVCGWVARRREHGEHLAFVDLRDHTGIIQCVIDHATDVRVPNGSSPSPGPSVTAPRAPSTPASARARWRSVTARSRSSTRPSFLALLRRRPCDESRRARAPRGYRYASTSDDRMQRNLPSGSGPGSTRPCGRPWSARASRRSRRRSCGRRPPRARGSSPCRPGCTTGPSTRCPRARSWPSSSSWWAGSTATSRSPAACATRTCAPTASSSSPSSTWRRPSSARTTWMAFTSEAVLDAAEAATVWSGRRP